VLGCRWGVSIEKGDCCTENRVSVRVVWSWHFIFTVSVNPTPLSYLHLQDNFTDPENKLLRAFRVCLCDQVSL
jgi:hypothetical protein